MKDSSKVTGLEDKFDMLVDSNDVILERVVSKLFLDVVLIKCSVATSFLFHCENSSSCTISHAFPQSDVFPFYFKTLPNAGPEIPAAKVGGPKGGKIIWDV